MYSLNLFIPRSYLRYKNGADLNLTHLSPLFVATPLVMTIKTQNLKLCHMLPIHRPNLHCLLLQIFKLVDCFNNNKTFTYKNYNTRPFSKTNIYKIKHAKMLWRYFMKWNSLPVSLKDIKSFPKYTASFEKCKSTNWICKTFFNQFGINFHFIY